SLLFSLAIAADGNSFWVGDHNSGQISRISMSTGSVLQTLTQPGFGAGGLLVYGEGRIVSMSRYVALGDSVPYGHGLANPFPDSQIGLSASAVQQSPSGQAYPA